MSAVSSAAGSGIVLGIVVVFLFQQFGMLGLSDLLSTLVYFVVAGLVGGVVFGGAATMLVRRARARAAATK
ncbi:MAG TPA: hypothetical protein VMH49_04050 [Thermoplasmata archaeon]|nr:hypothetical protein [Thermoplasmata archaeon]